MARRLFDLLVGSIGLACAAPLLLGAAIAIKLTSRGPVLYHAVRIGKDGVPFKMHKLRTMRVSGSDSPSVITSDHDARVYPFGGLLRRLKIDELPQLLNIVGGDMSVIGPRPEDPRIVTDHYTSEFWETLRVKPGLASPGSLYNYMHGQRLLAGESAESAYVTTVLPAKMKLDREYVANQSVLNDIRICLETVSTIGRYALGQRTHVDPSDSPEPTQSKD